MKRKKLISGISAAFLALLMISVPAAANNGVSDRSTMNEGEMRIQRRIRESTPSYLKAFGKLGEDVYVLIGYDFECYINSLIENTKHIISRSQRHIEYNRPWIDKSAATADNELIFNNFSVTRIYSNCFFADAYDSELEKIEIKFNGIMPDELCIGDYIECSYTNVFYDNAQARAEADMLSVCEDDRNLVAATKPIIYLYPEEETEVTVQLTFDGILTCTYPSYNDGWTVTASPDGTLTDENGQMYNYLYWEGECDDFSDFSEGFCVKGEDTAVFLENALDKLGLTRSEANEFIVYWLPLMEVNPYNIISFQSESYTNVAKLDVSPAPDTIIRVYMSWKKSDFYKAMPSQELTAPERTGFTVVEWGGSEVK